MTLLIKFFIKNYKDVKNPNVRTSYGKLLSLVGIVLNLLLFAAKLITGTLFNVVSVSADAFNNLSDAGSSIISLISFVFSAKPADEDHPYGHERLEYIFSLVVAFIIMFFGIQLIINSVQQIRFPEAIEFNMVMVAVLIVSIVVKAYMYLYNTKYSKKLDSIVMKGTAIDSISDVLATSVVLVGLVISHFTGLHLDGYLGIVVAVSIMKGGYDIVVDTFNKLIGEAPEPEYIKHVVDKIMGFDGILGVHDLVVHTYGPGKTFITVHAEVASDVNIVISHDIIDNIERSFQKDDNVDLVIHMDPVDNNDAFTKEMRTATQHAVQSIDPRLSIHDFRVVKGDTHNNFIFDVEVPLEFPMTKYALIEKIREVLPQGDVPHYAVITLDRAYLTWVDED